MTLAMALDNSFEIMNEDEMYDVNGEHMTVRALGMAIDVAIMVSGLLVSVLAYTKLPSFIKKRVASGLKSAFATVLAKVGLAATVIKDVTGIVFRILEVSVGSIIANIVDGLDGKKDGYCSK